MTEGNANTPLDSTESDSRVHRSDSLDAVFSHPIALAFVDLGLGLLAYVAAWLLRVYLTVPFTQDLLPQERWAFVSHPWVMLLASQLFLLYIMGMYDDMRAIRYREIIAQVFIVCVLQVALITSAFYLTAQVFPRTVILIFDVLNLVFLGFWRGFVKRRLGARVRRTLIVGRQCSTVDEIISNVEQSPWMGLTIVGLVVGKGEPAKEWGNYRVLGNLDRLQEIVVLHEVDKIILASEPSWRDEVLGELGRIGGKSRFGVAILPSVYDMVVGRLRHVNIHDTPLIEVTDNPNQPFERFVKRTFDFLASAAGLILLAPLFLVVGILVRLTSRGGVFYRQERVGKMGETFYLIKFRTMFEDAERKTGATFSAPNDPRVTAVGRLLRKISLDELPQLWNVLRGDMSFVGPRPERPLFVQQFLREVPGYGERHKVKPGITGLAQVRGYYHTRAENKLRYDLAYIYNYSFSMDLLILLETLKVILSRRDRENGNRDSIEPVRSVTEQAPEPSSRTGSP